VPTTSRRWWQVLAALIICAVSVLAGILFRSDEEVRALVIDLRAPYTQKTIDDELTAYQPFNGKMIFIVAGDAGKVCAAAEPENGKTSFSDLPTDIGYCPRPELDHLTVVLDRTPAAGDVQKAAGDLTVLRSGPRVSVAGIPAESFAWTAALVTGGLLAVVLLAGPRLLRQDRRHRESPAYPATTAYSGGLGVPMTDPYAARPLPAAPEFRPPRPREPVVVPRAAPWAPPTPAVVVLDAVDAASLPELARLVRDTGGRAVARTHAGAPGGYVAVGDVVVWGASSATGVLPGDAVGVEFTGDPAAPLTISPAPEQGYHQ
jgi:hypothetical protein